MPYTIQPLVPARTIQGYGSSLDESVAKLGSFDYSPDRAYRQVTVSSNVRGTLLGGPSYSRFLDFGSEQKYLPIAPRPALTTAILPDTAAFYRRQLGAIDFNAIDPYSTLNQVADQAQQVNGDDPFKALRGISSFLASKDIDIFGTGETGAPARAADYALAFPLAVLSHLTGTNLLGPVAGALPRGQQPKPEDDVYHQLHADPRYWQLLIQADPGSLDQLARNYAAQFVDTGTNSYVVEQLHAQFVRDRDVALGLSSGNDAVDYRAVKYAAGGSITQHFGGLQVLPLIGTQIVQALEPVTAAERANWAALDPTTRLGILSQFGTTQMVTDIVSSLPAFSALGTVMEIARAGGGMGRVLATSYDGLLRGAGWTASAGLTAALANWSLSAYSPVYAASIGKEVDMARPISGSFLAAEVNQIGYFASGSYGAFGVGKVASRIVGKALGEAAGQVVRGLGLPETPLYSYGLGGAVYADHAIAAGLPAAGLKLSAQRLTMSYAVHLVRKPLVDAWDAITSGAKTGRAELDELSIEERIAAANDELQASIAGAHSQAKAVFDVLAAARKPAALFTSDQGRQIESWMKSQARKIDEDMGQMFTQDYGPEWVARTAGAYTEPAIKAHVKTALERLGGDFSTLGGKIHGEGDWAKMMRLVHQYEFDAKNGELAAAFDVPGAPPSREAGRLALVSANHLFADRAEASLAALKAAPDAAAARLIIKDLVDSTVEGERWYVQTFRPRAKGGKPGIKSYETVNPATFTSWLEDIQPALLRRRLPAKPDATTAALPLNAFHSQLLKDGLWDLAFKPVDDAGNFVSYVKTRAGGAFQTPWLDYPMSNADNIELGNRGRLMTKYDGVFRAFRTWRVAEFQRGLLFRNLTGGKLNLDVLPSQIEAFNRDVMKMAGEHAVQPQTLGAVGEGAIGVGRAWTDQLNAIAEKHFGAGPYLTRSGERVAVNWRAVVSDSYRQSVKLNLTAGLTSYLKAHFGPVGAATALWSDVGYINFRFGLSPIFKLGEVEETLQLNAMAGVNPHGDPWVEQLFYRQGIGQNHGVMTQEQTYDQLLLGTGRQAPMDRQATAYGFLSLKAPETLAQKVERARLQTEAEAHAAYTRTPEAIQAAYDAGEVAKGQQLNRDVGIARGGTAESGGAMKAGPPKVDLELNVPPPEHLVNAEMATLVDDAGNVVKGNEERVAELQGILGEYEAARQFAAQVVATPLATDKAGLLDQLRQTLHDDGQTPVAGLEQRHAQIVDALAAFDAPTSAAPVDNLADLPGTAEFLISNINEFDPEILKPVAGERRTFMQQAGRALATVRNPIPFKQQQALLYRIEKLRREFPTLVRAAGLTGLEDVMKQLHVPERDWVTFLMEDRELATAFASSGHPDDLAALLAHAGPDARGQFDALYASEEWATLTGLWSIADRTAADDAFRVHFFNPYRSALERSLNHPLVGIYPLSWALKAGRQWMSFLYDNHTIAGLRLGMTPAVALNHIVRAQNATFAQTNDKTLEEYIGLKGPFGSAFLIFNLILPGDWSSIPFPASRTVRDLLRGTFTAQSLGNQVGSIGLARDARLLLETSGELKDFVWGPTLSKAKQPPAPWAPFEEPPAPR